MQRLFEGNPGYVERIAAKHLLHLAYEQDLPLDPRWAVYFFYEAINARGISINDLLVLGESGVPKKIDTFQIRLKRGFKFGPKKNRRVSNNIVAEIEHKLLLSGRGKGNYGSPNSLRESLTQVCNFLADSMVGESLEERDFLRQSDFLTEIGDSLDENLKAIVLQEGFMIYHDQLILPVSKAIKSKLEPSTILLEVMDEFPILFDRTFKSSDARTARVIRDFLVKYTERVSSAKGYNVIPQEKDMENIIEKELAELKTEKALPSS